MKTKSTVGKPKAVSEDKPARTEDGGTADFTIRWGSRLADVAEFRGDRRGGFGWKIRKDERVEVFVSGRNGKRKFVLKKKDAQDLATAIIANLGVR